MRNLRNYLEEQSLNGVNIREEESLIEGRPDARIGNIIVEFESPFDSKGNLRECVTSEKINKVRNMYLEECKVKGKPVRAIITNGIELVFLDEEGNLVERGLIC